MNIPALAESELRFTIEGDFAVEVSLIDPDANRYDESLNGGHLRGKVRWARAEATEEGATISVDRPSLVLRRSSLPREPKSREGWKIIMPSGPAPGSPLEYYEIDGGYSVEGGRSLGKISLPLVKLKQKETP